MLLQVDTILDIVCIYKTFSNVFDKLMDNEEFSVAGVWGYTFPLTMLTVYPIQCNQILPYFAIVHPNLTHII